MYKHEALSSFLLSFEGSRRIPPPGDSGSPTLTLTDRRLQYFVLPTVASHCLAHSLTPMYCRRLGGDSNLLTLQAPATTCHNFVIRLWEREEDVTSLLPEHQQQRATISSFACGSGRRMSHHYCRHPRTILGRLRACIF